MRCFPIIAFLILQLGNSLVTRAQQTHIHKYSIEDGLVNNDILNIYQDSQGFIWLCTRGGLSRYDGSRFTNFTTHNGLTHDMINDIIEIAPQQFIIAQNADGPRLLKNGRFSALVSGNKVTLNEFYTVTNNRLLAATDYKGVVEWVNGDFKPLDTAYTETTSHIALLNDSVWMLLASPFSIRLASSFLQKISPRLPVPATTVYTDSKHRTWMGTGTGLRLLDQVIQPGKPVTFLPLPPSFNIPILKQSPISDFLEDSQGNYWIGTFNGLVRIDKNGIAYRYTQKDGLPASSINCIKEDKQNNIWIGTMQGLAKFSLNNELNNFLPNTDFSTDGILAVSPVSENKLRVFHGKELSNLNLFTGELTNTLRMNPPGYQAYRLDKKQLLVINGRKGTIFHSGKEEVETIDWPPIPFVAVVRTGPNQFIGSYKDKLFTVSNGQYSEKMTTTAIGGIASMVIDKKGILWAGAWENGLFKISLTHEQDSLQLKLIDTFALRLPDQHIRALYADRENEIWIGTRYKGVIRLFERQQEVYEMQHYGIEQGLASDFILSVNRDSVGNIWIGSLQGLDKLVPAGNQYNVFNFGKVNKYFSRVYNVSFLGNNDLLITGFLSIIHAREMRQDTLPPPPVYITSISAGPADSTFPLYDGTIRLPYNKAQIYFEFSAPQFINEEFTKYSYRLLGSHDTSWNISAKSHSISFASLRPGSYTFQVRALGFNGKWGEPAIYAFIVNTPFWQKTWFILLLATAVGLLVYALYRYRVQQLMRLQKVRNRIANDLHDEIGSNLTNISILSSLGKDNLSEPQKTGGFLERISEEVSSSSQALDDIIWSVDTSHDTLEETIARMRRYAAELFDGVNTGYELYLDPAFEKTKLAMEQRRDIYLFYKEAVNNIAKHAAAKQVYIQVAIEHNQLLVSIKDDGKGFDTHQLSDRHGLKGMKDRIQKWKGSIVIQSGNKGTLIQARLPVSK